MKNNSTIMILVISLISVALIVGAVFFLSKNLSTTTVSNQVVSAKILYKENPHRLGDSNAKVQIVEFSDFECPACAVVEPEVKRFLETNKDSVSLIYRHYPLNVHLHSQQAARAAEAAHLQGKFWEMHDKLFDTQADWTKLDKVEETFYGYAKDLGLDVEKFKNDMNSEQVAEIIKRDMRDAEAAGLTATPTFYINGRKVTGFRSDAFNQVLREELAK
ncbi:MAG: DsbA family protein [Patescibacteria group bacterium]